MSEYPRLPLPPPPPPFNSGGRTSVPGLINRQHEQEREFFDQPSDQRRANENPESYRPRSIGADIRPVPCYGQTGTGIASSTDSGAGPINTDDPFQGTCICSCKPLTWVVSTGKKFDVSGGVVTSELADTVTVTVSSDGGCSLDNLSVMILAGDAAIYLTNGVATGADAAYYRGNYSGVFISPLAFKRANPGDTAMSITVGFSGQPYYKAGRSVLVLAAAQTGGGSAWHSRNWRFAPRAAAPDATGQPLVIADSPTYQPQLSPTQTPALTPTPNYPQGVRVNFDCCESVPQAADMAPFTSRVVGSNTVREVRGVPPLGPFRFRLISETFLTTTTVRIIEQNDGVASAPRGLCPTCVPAYPSDGVRALMTSSAFTVIPTGTNLMDSSLVYGAFSAVRCDCFCQISPDRPDTGT